MGELMLKIVTPEGEREPVVCDSVHLTVCDDADGKGGGSCGIRPGHVQALISLDEGSLDAFMKGVPVFQARCGTGFATVEQDTVTVVAEFCE
ncbi:MAG: hypothetical protein IJ043_09665 [Clostridia bacterium]|nr:hypothetical protein [Clostridia bacterium]